MLGESAVPSRVILTKADKVKAAARAKLIDETSAELKTYIAAWPEPLLTSSHEKREYRSAARCAGLIASLRASEAIGSSGLLSLLDHGYKS